MKRIQGLKLNVPRALRLQLFLSSVKGPFLTSGVLGIFKKTLLPCRGNALTNILHYILH